LKPRKGYVLPINFKSKWISYQQREAKQWRFTPQYGNDLAQAYRLYTLALAGAPDLSAMNRLERPPTFLTKVNCVWLRPMLWRVKSSWCFFIAETTIDDKVIVMNIITMDQVKETKQ
jgi:hypothetical protein